MTAKAEVLRKLEVRLERARDDSELVGQLVEHKGRVGFEYAPTFIAAGRSSSPLKLPLQPGLVWAPAQDRLHGVFDDALPDGWGMLLMDRHFRRSGFDVNGIGALDRLAYLGGRTMGALSFFPPAEDRPVGSDVIDLQQLSDAAEQVLQGRAAELLPQLQYAGGTPGGARPKVLVALCGDQMRTGSDLPPEGYESWLIKFTGWREAADTGAVEHVYANLARRAGICVPETRLFVTAAGQRCFGVRRFDRVGATRLHIHTLAGILNADFRLPNLDYDHFLRVTAQLTRSHPDVREAFRRMLFNVLAHNRDDHGKNTSYIMNWDGEWSLAPAYDLTFSPGPGGHHTIAVHGETASPTWAGMLALARPAGIDEPTAVAILEQVREAVDAWPVEARAHEVDAGTIARQSKRLAAVSQAAKLPTIGAVARRSRRR
jgi:serine/threonine-protein kinase HipA